MPSSASQAHLHRVQTSALRAVASFEFAKGLVVLLAGILALLLVHKDAWVIAESLLALLHINPDRRYAQLFLDFADRVTDARLWEAAGVAATYSTLRFVEAYGLWKERSWAEWVALISGSLLLPWEVRELIKHATLLRIGLFLGNAAIVVYMLYLLREGHRARAMRKHPHADR
jgi:uncharacterized membrane protein (DUF2068 family)